MKKNAVVTGANSGIGYQIARYLLDDGYTVYGISRNCDQADFDQPGWHPINCDLTDEKQLQKVCEQILEDTGKKIDVLVLSAGRAWFGPHETHQPDQISGMVDLNFKAPLLLINRFLCAIREQNGHIIGIGSVAGKSRSPQGGVYAATKAGFHHFLDVLFDETRKQGVKVTRIVPDLTQTPFYDDLNFEPEHNAEAYVNPEELARAIDYVLNSPQAVITELELRPQKLQIRKKSSR